MTEEEGKKEEEKDPDWIAFEEFTKAILQVPKEEIDRRDAEEKARKNRPENE